MDGGAESAHMLTGLDNAHCTKGRMENSTLGPHSLGCQLLGSHHYTCAGKKVLHNHLLQIMSYPAPLLHSLGRYDSQIPSCNIQPKIVCHHNAYSSSLLFDNCCWMENTDNFRLASCYVRPLLHLLPLAYLCFCFALLYIFVN